MFKNKKVVFRQFFFCVLIIFAGTGVVFSQTAKQFPELKNQYDDGLMSAQSVANEYLKNVIDDKFQKCGTDAARFFTKYKDEIDQNTLDALGLSQSREKLGPNAEMFLSSSGKFKIFYEISGTHAVPLDDNNGNSIPDYVEWVGEAFDSSYAHTINTLQFTDPIPSGGTYHVYLKNTGNVYGTTHKDSGSPGGTYISLHHNFIGFPPNNDPDGNQLGSLRVTAAHEFKHAVQFAQNEWRGEPDNWAEMDATLMEEVVYDDVNDYYNYLFGFSGTVFSSPGNSVIPGSYQHITWALYFYEQFGPFFWTEVWDLIEQDPLNISFLGAIEQNLYANGYDYQSSITELYMWHLAGGGQLSASDYGFKERHYYPDAFIRHNPEELSDSLSDANFINNFSAHFMDINLENDVEGQARVVFEHTSDNLNFGFLAYLKNGGTDYKIVQGKEGGVTDYYTPWNWEDLSRLTVSIVNTSTQTTSTFKYALMANAPDDPYLAQNYPNPFNPGTTIQYGITKRQHIILEIFDYTGRRIQTLVDGVKNPGVYHVNFDAGDLASGVYLYRLRTPSGTYHNKMTLIK